MTGALTKTVLDAADPTERGEAQGRLWAGPIAELAALRRRLTLERSDLPDEATLRRLAAAHLPVLDAFAPDLHAELRGTARAAGVHAEDLVVLNHYTDLRDLRRAAWKPAVEEEGCSAALLPRPTAPPLTAQTWDMHASARPYVRLVEVRPPEGPAATLLTLTGCLGMAGMNEHGVAVLINNLHTPDARVGVVWCAIVRRMLAQRTARDARAVLRGATQGSGHHYLVADADDAWAVETTGTHEVELGRGVGTTILHTNHGLADATRGVERPPATSTTRERLERLRARGELLRAGGGPADAADAAGLLADHAGWPRSLCSHLSVERGPDATDTCAAVVFDHASRRVAAVDGCAVERPWVVTTVGEDGVEPFRPRPLREAEPTDA